ncbi:MAG: hypothetical protein AXA67_05730 [Methylothermaceae bacteria B42]|nr:MAG: hypothetical protein AXA67_05730 [Methylothermaceae bacteria B42]
MNKGVRRYILHSVILGLAVHAGLRGFPRSCTVAAKIVNFFDNLADIDKPIIWISPPADKQSKGFCEFIGLIFCFIWGELIHLQGLKGVSGKSISEH